jgi:adenosylmethionine-8-amino-7-oxononanoate aminotransferase
VRGRGFFIGIELVADRERRTPFDPALGVAGRIGEAARGLGMLCYPVAGIVDGIRGDGILLAPPYNATAAELEELVALTGRAVRAALAGLPR